MKQISLINSDKKVLVDDEDFEYLTEYAWWEYIPKKGVSTYAYGVKLPRRTTGEKVVKMHRLITNAPKELVVDHVDNNGLNNCKDNLRLVTLAQNSQRANNSASNPNKKHSKYRGVSYLGWYGKYLAYVDTKGKRKYLGYFDTDIEAAQARDALAKVEHGDFAVLNFPT